MCRISGLLLGTQGTRHIKILAPIFHPPTGELTVKASGQQEKLPPNMGRTQMNDHGGGLPNFPPQGLLFNYTKIVAVVLNETGPLVQRLLG